MAKKLPLVLCALTSAWLAFASCAASAEGIQAQCGSESGRAFAVEGGLIAQANAGWYDDAMNGQTVVRINTDTGDVDVRFRDATGIWQSPADGGGSAMLFGAQRDPSAFMVAVMYPGRTVEVLTIAANGNTAKLIHTVSRMTDRITNSRVMTADCVLTTY